MASRFSIDFTGRTVDLLIFQGVAPFGDNLVRRGYGGETGGQLVTGIQKVAQTFAMLFLTQQGTVPRDLEKGTSFLQAMRSGAIQNETDLVAEFGEAVALLQQQLINAESAELPLDEQFASAELVDFTIDRLQSSISLDINIRSVAGDELEFFLPVSFAIV